MSQSSIETLSSNNLSVFSPSVKALGNQLRYHLKIREQSSFRSQKDMDFVPFIDRIPQEALDKIQRILLDCALTSYEYEFDRVVEFFSAIAPRLDDRQHEKIFEVLLSSPARYANTLERMAPLTRTAKETEWMVVQFKSSLFGKKHHEIYLIDKLGCFLAFIEKLDVSQRKSFTRPTLRLIFLCAQEFEAYVTKKIDKQKKQSEYKHCFDYNRLLEIQGLLGQIFLQICSAEKMEEDKAEKLFQRLSHFEPAKQLATQGYLLYFSAALLPWLPRATLQRSIPDWIVHADKSPEHRKAVANIFEALTVRLDQDLATLALDTLLPRFESLWSNNKSSDYTLLGNILPALNPKQHKKAFGTVMECWGRIHYLRCNEHLGVTCDVLSAFIPRLDTEDMDRLLIAFDKKLPSYDPDADFFPYRSIYYTCMKAGLPNMTRAQQTRVAHFIVDKLSEKDDDVTDCFRLLDREVASNYLPELLNLLATPHVIMHDSVVLGIVLIGEKLSKTAREALAGTIIETYKKDYYIDRKSCTKILLKMLQNLSTDQMTWLIHQVLDAYHFFRIHSDIGLTPLLKQHVYLTSEQKKSLTPMLLNILTNPHYEACRDNSERDALCGFFTRNMDLLSEDQKTLLEQYALTTGQGSFEVNVFKKCFGTVPEHSADFGWRPR